VRTLGSYSPILHSALKTIPPQWGLHRNCEMPPCGHMGVALRGWSHLHLYPNDTPLSSWQVWFRTCRAQLGLTPRSARWCVRKSYRQVDPLGFRQWRAHILQAQVKPQHLGSENRHSRDTLRSAPLSPIPDRLFRAHPRQSTQNAFSCRFYPTHAKNHYSQPNTCIAKLSVYTRLYKHI
jgi:hypothetical protein